MNIYIAILCGLIGVVANSFAQNNVHLVGQSAPTHRGHHAPSHHHHSVHRHAPVIIGNTLVVPSPMYARRSHHHGHAQISTPNNQVQSVNPQRTTNQHTPALASKGSAHQHQ